MRKVGTGALLGLAAGFIGGLFGVGGGLVMVPGMVLLMNVAQSRAHATSVAAIIASASASVVPLALEDKVLWAAAALILIGSLLGAFIGARSVDRLPDVWLARGFVVLVLVAAARMALVAGPETGSELAAGSLQVSVAGAIGLVALGLVAGAVASVLGIGGGIVYVPALAALYAFPQHVAQATSLAVIVPTMVVATATHARSGRVDWRLAAMLGAGGLAGGLIGAGTALALDALVLKRLFAGFLVLMALRMFDRTRRSSHAPAPT